MAPLTNHSLLPAGVGLLAGIFALQLNSIGSDSQWWVLVPLFVIAIYGFRRAAVFRPFILGVIVGMGVFTLSAKSVIDGRLEPVYVGDSIMLDIEVIDFPTPRGRATSFVGRPIGDRRFPARLRLSWFEPPEILRLGQQWRLEVRLKRPRGHQNPDGFDLERWLFRERIGATGYVVASHRNRLLPDGELSRVSRTRLAVVARVFAQVEHPEAAAVLTAIVVGARHAISDAQWQRYNRTGTSHLVAISGLHIGLAAGSAWLLAMGVTGLLRSPGDHHTQAIVVATISAVGYAVLSGLAIPSQRASLMLVLASVALLVRRPANGFRILLLVAITTAVADPLGTMAPGFILSFSAVATLLWISRRWRRSTHRQSGVVLQSALLLGLLPFTALLFDRVSTVSLLINLFAIPLFSFIVVPSALLGGLLDGWAAPLGNVLLGLAALVIVGFDEGVRIAAAMSPATLALHADIPTWVLLLPAVWVWLPPGWPMRSIAWVGCAAIALWPATRPQPGCVDVTVLDVGQGLAALVQTAEYDLLYDTGIGFRNGGSSATATILPFLQARGIRELDTVVVSHGDNDHAGGLHDLLLAMPAGQLLTGEPVAGHVSESCFAGQTWTEDDVNFEILHPTPAFSGLGNDGSCVLRISTREQSLLMSGDIEIAAEHALVRDGVLAPADIVLVPHHGSKTSSSPPFVAAVQAKLAIVSAGFGNQWGFPKGEVVERWQRSGATVLNTAESGAIGVRWCDGDQAPEITETRHDNRRIWHE